MSTWILLSLLACGKDAGDTADLEPTFTNVQETALVSCGISSTCHTGAGAAGLSLDEDVAYDELVGVESSGAPGSVLVVAGDADGSYLVQKLEGAAGISGDVMPPDAPLPSDQIALVREWIDAGAADD